MDNIKIVFAGLDSAGKTSFLNTMEEKYSTLMNIKPTLGADRRQFKIFGFTVSNWDLGGQKTYRDTYLDEKDRYFTNISTLFYIFDIQDESRADEAFLYFKLILEALEQFNEQPKIIFCWHKFDADLKKEKTCREQVARYEQRLSNLTGKRFFPVTFKTSIFDKWSLLKAFSEGIIGLSPKKAFINSQLKDFARRTFSSAVLLLDPNYLLIGSSTHDEALLEVCEAIVPYASEMASNLDRYDINTENIVVSLKPGDYYRDVLEGKELVSQFIPLNIDGTSFSLLSLTKNPRTLKLMLRHGGKLASNLKDLLKTLYF
ncbi:hypothetical protein GF325_04620 [Candidatus Bathyarchaeota archaeon]|nr:hypothetical protein [Candidatus Bathyarchaeota archaeon]